MCSQRKLVVLIVFIALLLDNLLLTCIVPILPNYFRESRRSSGQNGNNLSAEYDLETPFQPASLDRIHNSTINRNNLWVSRTRAHGNESWSDNENTKLGLLLGAKTFVQLVTNLIVGPLTNRVGYTVPMFSGFVILFISTIMFALVESYTLLFVARSIQGVGTALSTTSGMGLLASLFPDQRERSVAQTTAFSGLAAGVLIGPPYGGVLYDWTGGKMVPCLILAALALFEGVLQLAVIRPQYRREDQKGSSIQKLLTDPYIFITALTITMSSLVVAVLEPVLPIWMFHTMGAPAWLQGVAFVPSTLSYLIWLQILGVLTHRSRRLDVSNSYLTALWGSLLLGASIILVPFCENIYYLIAPLFINGMGLALVSSSMLPHVGYLVDRRHEPVYGSAYAITDNAFCIAFAVGPSISGPLVDTVGFSWTLISLGAVTIVTAPMVCFLRNPPARDRETKPGELSLLVPKAVGISSSGKN